MPDIGSSIINQYSNDWWLWWTGLQPSCRGTEVGALSRALPAGDIDWSPTWKGGSNGFFIIIIALCWWFLGVKHNNGCADGCKMALQDVVWVLQQMLKTQVESVKRGHDEEGTIAQQKAKKYLSWDYLYFICSWSFCQDEAFLMWMLIMVATNDMSFSSFRTL
jgi:hypothetical protein